MVSCRALMTGRGHSTSRAFTGRMSASSSLSGLTISGFATISLSLHGTQVSFSFFEITTIAYKLSDS